MQRFIHASGSRGGGGYYRDFRYQLPFHQFCQPHFYLVGPIFWVCNLENDSGFYSILSCDPPTSYKGDLSVLSYMASFGLRSYFSQMGSFRHVSFTPWNLLPCGSILSLTNLLSLCGELILVGSGFTLVPKPATRF